jgi:hypothetical protein
VPRPRPIGRMKVDEVGRRRQGPDRASLPFRRFPERAERPAGRTDFAPPAEAIWWKTRCRQGESRTARPSARLEPLPCLGTIRATLSARPWPFSRDTRPAWHRHCQRQVGLFSCLHGGPTCKKLPDQRNQLVARTSRPSELPARSSTFGKWPKSSSEAFWIFPPSLLRHSRESGNPEGVAGHRTVGLLVLARRNCLLQPPLSGCPLSRA